MDQDREFIRFELDDQSSETQQKLLSIIMGKPEAEALVALQTYIDNQQLYDLSREELRALYTLLISLSNSQES